MFQTLSDLYRFVPGPLSWETFAPWEVSTGVGVVLHQLLKVIVRSGFVCGIVELDTNTDKDTN